MKLQQLLENAHLDALGMLDASEQAEFQSAFASAPPAVRAQVRSEQARAADMGDLLPDVSPTDQLRDRVLAAISAQILAESAGSLGSGDSDVYEMRSATSVSRRWRTAAVGLIGACGVLAIAVVNVMVINTQIKRSMAVNDLPMEVTRGLGSEHTIDVLFSQSSRRDIFESVGSVEGQAGVVGGAGLASILHNASWDNGVLAYKGLPQVAGKEYRLVVLTDDGQIGQEIATLETDGDRNIGTMNVASRFLKSGTRLAIIAADIGAESTNGRLHMQTRLS